MWLASVMHISVELKTFCAAHLRLAGDLENLNTSSFPTLRGLQIRANLSSFHTQNLLWDQDGPKIMVQFTEITVVHLGRWWSQLSERERERDLHWPEAYLIWLSDPAQIHIYHPFETFNRRTSIFYKILLQNLCLFQFVFSALPTIRNLLVYKKPNNFLIL